MTTFLLRLTDEDAAALRATADAENTSMNEVALQAIREATSRRAQIKAHVAAVKKDHAATLAELADR